jgi:hypothetical protein
MLADMKRTVSFLSVTLLMYSGDVALHLSNPENLQAAFDGVNAWVKENSMIINGIKTKVMKFRKGGKLAKYHHFICGKHRLEALRGSNTCDMQNIIHVTHLGQICSSNSSDPQHSKSILAINWHSNSTFQSKNLSRSNLWGTAELERPHGTECEEAGKHKSHVPKKNTVHLQPCANQNTVQYSLYHLLIEDTISQ